MQFTDSTGDVVPSVTALEMRHVDELMVDTYQIALLQMMENAGRALADLSETIFKKAAPASQAQITVLVGPGGNGGGGLVAARHLANRGHAIEIRSASPHTDFTVVTSRQAKIAEALGLSFSEITTIPPSDLILDCLLGYSLVDDPREPFKTLIQNANQSGAPIISLDTPSGLNVTTGEVKNPCIKATATLTLALPKSGFLTETALPYLGDLFLADISVPASLYAKHLDLTVPTHLFSMERIVALSKTA